MSGPISMKRQNVNEKPERPPYLNILPETIRERFNLLDLSTDFFDPWPMDDAYPSSIHVTPISENRPRSGTGMRNKEGWERLLPVFENRNSKQSVSIYLAPPLTKEN